MSPPRLPMRVHLSAGTVVVLDGAVKAPRARLPRAPLFSELAELVRHGEVTVTTEGDGRPVELGALSLREFHALRAIATRLGWLHEPLAHVDCRNCAHAFEVAPCAALALGPFTDGELDDPELDATLDPGTAQPIPQVALPGDRIARDVRLRDLTVAQAAPMHRALRRRQLSIHAAFVRAMGIAALGPETEPHVIAGALARCSQDAWEAIGDAFLATHYSLRLGALVLCPMCGARNDVDAPWEREFAASAPAAQIGESNGAVFPDFDAFADHAQASYARIAGALAEAVRLEIDEGVPACDDGGEPLLGSYVAPGGDPQAPVGSGAVTLYYRTFRAQWDERGPHDWQAEIDETLEHELAHHAGWVAGSDPMDDDERSAIDDERARVVGRRAVARQSVAALGADVRGFVARTWLIWVIVAAATVAITVCER